METGAVFDTSRQPNRGPLPFKLGEGKVIPGEQSIAKMETGLVQFVSNSIIRIHFWQKLPTTGTAETNTHLES